MNFSEEQKRPTRQDRERILSRLNDAGGLKEGASRTVHEDTGIPEADVYGAGSFYSLLSRPHKKVRICQGLSCRMASSEELLSHAEKTGMPVEGCSCLAACDQPNAMLVERSLLTDMTVADLDRAKGNWKNLRLKKGTHPAMGSGYVYPEDEDSELLVFNLMGQQDFSAEAFNRAQAMGTDGVIHALDASGLQGRGGAAFPAALKWKSIVKTVCSAGDEKTPCVVLNADEAEPGTFKDREIILRRPDLVLEGLAIAAKTIGAREVYVYIRGAFEMPRKALEAAIVRVVNDKLYPEIAFHIHEGHGAYICGEETAQFEAHEGKRGMPRLKPPFPTEKGLWAQPTLIHNVETIAAVPAIVKKGGEWFKALGKTGSGTKLYCISGHVKRPGVYELPLGITLDALLKYANGPIGTLKAFSPGGASSGFLPASERSRPLDWPHLHEKGSSLGSAGVVVINDTINMAEAAHCQLEFFEAESCGQCAPCRIGTRFLREALERIRNLKGKAAAWKTEKGLIDDVAWEMTEGSICGLGQSAALPLTSAMKWFPEDFES